MKCESVESVELVKKTVCDPLPVNVNWSSAKLGEELAPCSEIQSVPAAFGKEIV
jgi:hypothetical protein